MSTNGSYYDLLEVPQTATESELKRAYHRLALQYHPDKAGPEGLETFKRIREAYDVLQDPNRRRLYDLYGEQGLRMLDNDMMSALHPFLLNPAQALCAFACFGTALLLFMLFPILVVVQVDLRMGWNWFAVCAPAFLAEVLAIGITATGCLLQDPETGERGCSCPSATRVLAVSAFNVLLCFKLQGYSMPAWYVCIPLILTESIALVQLPFRVSRDAYQKAKAERDLESQQMPEFAVPESQETYSSFVTRRVVGTLWHVGLVALSALKVSGIAPMPWAVAFLPVWLMLLHSVVSGFLDIRRVSEDSPPELCCHTCVLLTGAGIVTLFLWLLVSRLEHGDEGPKLWVVFIPIFVFLALVLCCIVLLGCRLADLAPRSEEPPPETSPLVPGGAQPPTAGGARPDPRTRGDFGTGDID